MNEPRRPVYVLFDHAARIIGVYETQKLAADAAKEADADAYGYYMRIFVLNGTPLDWKDRT